MISNKEITDILRKKGYNTNDKIYKDLLSIYRKFQIYKSEPEYTIINPLIKRLIEEVHRMRLNKLNNNNHE